ncbi:fatty acyl-AMP ligase [Streptomyces sp. NPDC021622]|uniref:fatty acyl-AMP ligase n=1 Tax=Streptomyces sp. NPDC021622 TaxID=3155013 RepID=UPI0033C2DAAA
MTTDRITERPSAHMSDDHDALVSPDHATSPDHLVGRLEAHARDIPDQPAVVFVRHPDGRPVEETLTYGALDREARKVAAWLRGRCMAGDRVMLLYGTGLEFVKVLIGCMYAGVVAVPSPMPGQQRGHDTRSAGIVRDADVRLVLTTSGELAPITAFLAEADAEDVPCVATDTLDLAEAPGWRVPVLDAATLVILQYTSGSTSDPKGVRVTHGSLAHNVGEMTHAFGLDSGSRIGSWLPQHHDMGLMGKLLLPLHLGATTVLMSPMDFLRRPHLWLRLLDTYRITTTVAPNFAYDLCVRRVTDDQLAGVDLSRVRNAGNGSEPVSARTLLNFAERFASAGFRLDAFNPCYGMAETTLLVTGTGPDRAPVLATVDADALARKELRALPADAEGARLVSSGRVNDMTVRIVDADTGRTLPDGRVGEIWVRGDSVADGYWRNPEATERIFRARTAEGEGPYLRTGDTGALRDGELFVTGRVKEMLVVNGRNLYPHDLEREVQDLHEAFQGLAGSVCSVTADGERVVVMQEMRPRGSSAADLPELARAVRGALAERVGIRVGGVVFLRPGQVRRTTSGKIRRSHMRELFTDGSLPGLYEDLDAPLLREFRGAALAAQAPGRSA